jgi:hypothetical protein
MSRDGGHVLVELLVASVCAALVGAAALTLLLNGATASARARDRVYDAARARACRDVLLANIQQALDGLEGAHTVYRGGLARHRVEVRADGVALLRLLEDSAEVAVDEGRYRLPSDRALGAFAPGALVAALPGANGDVVLGEVIAIDTSAAGTRLLVNWAAADTARLAEPVRALAPVGWREFAFVASEPGVDVRRRNAGGTWQPVVDGLVGIELVYASDRDDDGVADAPFVAWDQALLPVRAARVTCRVDSDMAAATGWAGHR